MNFITKTFTFTIEHDRTYHITIGINSEKIGPDDHDHLFIPVSLPISENNLNASLFQTLNGILAVMLSSIILSRLGAPKIKKQVTVFIDGFFHQSIKTECEIILQKFMMARTVIANKPCNNHKVKIISKDGLKRNFNISFSKTKIIIPFSGGLDSTIILDYYRSAKEYVLYPFFVEYESEDQLSDIHYDKTAAQQILEQLNIPDNTLKVIFDEIKKKIPWQTRIFSRSYSKDPSIQDRDDWDFYGRNAVLSSLMLFMSVELKAQYICFGHTKEGLFSIFETKNNIFYDRCGASCLFIKYFNNILQKIFGQNSPQIIAPLFRMNKGNIVGNLMRNHHLFSMTRSCISYEDFEDGICFCCFDKMTGIFTNVDYNKLNIIKSDTGFEISEGQNKLANFNWVPERYNSGFWGFQLKKFMKQYPNISINLTHSIYSPYAIIAACYNMERNQQLEQYIPNEYFQLKQMDGIDNIYFHQIYEQYSSSMSPATPAQFLKKYDAMLNENYY